MQVHSLTRFAVVAALSLTAATLIATTAQAQELDPSETLQARNLAAQVVQTPSRGRAAVVAEARNLQASGQLKSGELSGAPVVDPVPVPHALTRAEVKAELAQWRATHRVAIGELG